MAIYEVELWAFRDAGKIRKVRAPIDATLDDIYRLGQNDFQPVPNTRSVSCGDVIRFDGKRFMVVSVGFEEVAADFIPDTNDPMLGYRK